MTFSLSDIVIVNHVIVNANVNKDVNVDVTDNINEINANTIHTTLPTTMMSITAIKL